MEDFRGLQQKLKIEEITEIISQSFCRTLDISKSVKIEKQKLINDLLPFHINIISSAARGKLKETAHSKILHDLLHHEKILSSFLEDIVGIDPNTFSKKDINYPDQDRIDLSLISIENRKFLIIENKINNAPEREAQLYRYVNEIAKDQYGFKDNEIDIVYLNPDINKPPSLFSRSKQGTGMEFDERTIKVEKIILKNYKYDILEWLKKLQKWDLNKEEPFLKSAIFQYIDYLEEFFEINDRNKKIHEKMKDQIFESLKLNESISKEEQLKILDEYSHELDVLQNEIKRIRKDVEDLKFREEIKILIDSEKIHIPSLRYYESENKLMLDFSCLDETYTLQIRDDLYWTIASDKKPSSINQVSLDKLRSILKSMDNIENIKDAQPYIDYSNKNDANFIFYNRANKANLINYFKRLIYLLRQNPKEIEFK